MLLVRRGVARLERAGRFLTLLPGSLVLLAPGQTAGLARGPDCEVSGFSFGAPLLDPLALDSGGEPVYEALRLGAREREPVAARLGAEAFREACSLFALIERDAAEAGPGQQALVRLRLMEAVLLLYRALPGPKDAEAPATGRFRLDEVQRFLQQRYTEELTLAGIAARYGLNPTYLSRQFHKEAGIPLVAYINRIRIQRSCLLLKRTRMSVVEIAFSVGYNNLSHFNRYFRRIVGMSPREYRASGAR